MFSNKEMGYVNDFYFLVKVPESVKVPTVEEIQSEPDTVSLPEKLTVLLSDIVAVPLPFSWQLPTFDEVSLHE